VRDFHPRLCRTEKAVNFQSTRQSSKEAGGPKDKASLFLVCCASSNRRSENVVVETIIVPELKLRNVKMQAFLVDVVECADDSALEDAPEALNRLVVAGFEFCSGLV
jgi:hypothetical protein